MPVSELSSSKVYRVPTSEIVVPMRQRRRARKKKEFEEFKDSIVKFGQLQPGVCRLDEDGSPVLIVGEGRLVACEQLGILYSYILKEDVHDPADLFEIELHENIRREDLHFTDKCEAILRLHELRQEQKGTTRPGAAGGHGVRDTASELHLSVGSVGEDIKIAMFARSIGEVKEAPNRSTARKIIQRIEEEIYREEALDEAIEKDKAQQQTNEEDSEIDSDNEGATPASPQESRLLEYNRRCLLGSFEETIPDLPEDFDVVCFDPPWGVDLDSVYKQTGSTKSYSDPKEQISNLLPGWLELLYSHMAENSHLYLFFGIVHHELIYSSLESAGFVTNRMPIFWKKRGAHRTRAPEVWPGRCYEAIAYARKGSLPLARYGVPDICETSAPSPKMKLSHPSAKHPDIYRDLLSRSCTPGLKVLDPMAGSGMFGVAAESLRSHLALDWWQIEKEDEFLVLQLWNLNLGYSSIIGDKGVPDKKESVYGKSEPREVPNLPEDFKSLSPGTGDWFRYWNEHPDKQTEMLEWKKSLG